jgi:hypothetical protein
MMLMQSPKRISTSNLIDQVQREIQEYTSRQSSDDRYSYELFRRACVLRDEHAWSGICHLYSSLISSWILRAVSNTALTSEEVASLTNATFAKFARSITPRKFDDFPTIKHLLAYCKQTACSVALDEMRYQQPHQLYEQPFEDVEHEPLFNDPAEIVLARLESNELWQILSREMKSEAEQLTLHHLYVLGWPPRQLQQRFPQAFPSVDDVYRVNRNLIERLRRNRKLRELLKGGQWHDVSTRAATSR